MKNLWFFLPDIYTHGERHKVEEKHFKNRFWPVHPLGVALGPLSKVKIENHRIVLFDSSNEASWCTDCNAIKTRTHFNGPFLKKWNLTVKKVQQNLNLFTVFFSRFFPKCYLKQSKFLHHCTQWIKHLMNMNSFEKNQEKTTIRVQFFWTFLTVKSYFFKNGPSKRVLVFCVAISASRRFIWAIKRHYPMIFNFHFSWFRGGLSATPRGWTGQKLFSKCFSWTLWHSPSI